MRGLARIGNFIGWVAIIYGSLKAAASLPVLYMLMTGAVRPGEPYFVDDLAPMPADAFLAVLIGIGTIVAGSLVRVFSRKRFASRVPNDSHPDAPRNA